MPGPSGKKQPAKRAHKKNKTKKEWYKPLPTPRTPKTIITSLGLEETAAGRHELPHGRGKASPPGPVQAAATGRVAGVQLLERLDEAGPYGLGLRRHDLLRKSLEPLLWLLFFRFFLVASRRAKKASKKQGEREREIAARKNIRKGKAIDCAIVRAEETEGVQRSSFPIGWRQRSEEAAATLSYSARNMVSPNGSSSILPTKRA